MFQLSLLLQKRHQPSLRSIPLTPRLRLQSDRHHNKLMLVRLIRPLTRIQLLFQRLRILEGLT